MRALLVLPLALAACREEEAPPTVRRDVAQVWSFDRGVPALAAGPGDWKVVPAPDAPSPPHVLAQEARNESPVYNVALLDAERGDVEITVKLKAVGGEIDQGGGVVWRAKDAENYYIARYNPLESNFRLYKVVAGARTQLATADAPAAPGWHDLRVTMEGDAIACELDGKVRLEAKDATFPGRGKIGFWTKADARTQFDDLSVR